MLFLNIYFLPLNQKIRGRTKKIEFHCEDRRKKKDNFTDPQNCKLSFGESIRLPNEPEGWSRILMFTYDYQKSAIDKNSFRCLDIP